MEHAIRILARHVPGADTLAGAEWWALSVPTSKGVAWHFDLDPVEERRDVVVHPAFSSVLYLTPEGGPTIIIDQRLAGSGTLGPQATAGMAYLPAANRFGIFDGALRHAVAGISDDRCRETTRRTLLINWWATKPVASGERDDASVTGLQVCAPIPEDDAYFKSLSADPDETWTEPAPEEIAPMPLTRDDVLSLIRDSSNSCPVWHSSWVARATLESMNTRPDL